MGGGVSVPVCSNANPSVLVEGQESLNTPAWRAERPSERVGSGGKRGRATLGRDFPPASTTLPNTYPSCPFFADAASYATQQPTPDPSADQLLPSHLAIQAIGLPPAVVKLPPVYTLLPE